MISTVFSIIIPTYNSSKTIEKTVRSVLNQSYKNFELIVVDDGSTDNTVAKLKNFRNPKIKLFKIKKSGGPAKPRNYGINKSNSNWICFLDSDDTWERNKLKVLYNHTKLHKFDILCHNEFLVSKNSSKISSYGPHKKNFYKHLLINGNSLSTSAVMINKNFLKKNHLQFNENKNFVSVEDYDLWMMFAKNHAKFFFIEDILGSYLIHNSGISQNDFKHLKNLGKLLCHHIFKVQKFENNKESLWKYLQKKIYILLLIKNFRKKSNNLKLKINIIMFFILNPLFLIKFYKNKYFI